VKKPNTSSNTGLGPLVMVSDETDPPTASEPVEPASDEKLRAMLDADADARLACAATFQLPVYMGEKINARLCFTEARLRAAEAERDSLRKAVEAADQMRKLAEWHCDPEDNSRLTRSMHAYDAARKGVIP